MSHTEYPENSEFKQITRDPTKLVTGGHWFALSCVATHMMTSDRLRRRREETASDIENVTFSCNAFRKQHICQRLSLLILLQTW
jgi:trimethylamine:corrinoid methyltransferase-like protein